MVLQDSQRPGDNLPLDATAVNSDGDVLAKWFHVSFVLSSVAVQAELTGSQPFQNNHFCGNILANRLLYQTVIFQILRIPLRIA